MSITSEQLRAARALLHLQQKQLAFMSKVSLSTIRRFEAGTDVRYLHADALRRALIEAGVRFIDGEGGGAVPDGSVGVVLLRAQDLPPATLARIAADRGAAVATDVDGDAGAAAQPMDDGPEVPDEG